MYFFFNGGKVEISRMLVYKISPLKSRTFFKFHQKYWQNIKRSQASALQPMQL